MSKTKSKRETERFPRYSRSFTKEEIAIVHAVMISEDITPFDPFNGTVHSTDGSKPDAEARRKWRKVWRRANAWRLGPNSFTTLRPKTLSQKQEIVMEWLWNERGLREIFAQIDSSKRT